jgi:hypothetical protein
VLWQVYNSRNVDGTLKYYDGSDDAVLNVNGKVLFTHEFLYAFLDQSGDGRLSFAGYWRASVTGWQRNLSYYLDSGVHVPLFVQQFLDLIKRPFMDKVFLDAVFDFITLLDFNYEDAFACGCADDSRNRNILTAVYDNCCKFMQSLLLRYPEMAEHYQFIIDALHHSGHSHCSPLYNHKMSVALKHVNAAINEQKNRILRYMETSVAFMGQIRAAVYIRYHLARLSVLQKRVNAG